MRRNKKLQNNKGLWTIICKIHIVKENLIGCMYLFIYLSVWWKIIYYALDKVSASYYLGCGIINEYKPVQNYKICEKVIVKDVVGGFENI